MTKVAPVPPENRDIALKDYAQTLHDYTQRQWQDARRQAELAAQHVVVYSSRHHDANGLLRKAKAKKV